MFYTIENGSFTTVNCAIQPNPDVSGIGIRIAFYLQAFCSIIQIWNVTQSSPTDIVLTNLSLQVAGLSLIVAAYFDGSPAYHYSESPRCDDVGVSQYLKWIAIVVSTI